MKTRYWSWRGQPFMCLTGRSLIPMDGNQPDHEMAAIYETETKAAEAAKLIAEKSGAKEITK